RLLEARGRVSIGLSRLSARYSTAGRFDHFAIEDLAAFAVDSVLGEPRGAAGIDARGMGRPGKTTGPSPPEAVGVDAPEGLRPDLGAGATEVVLYGGQQLTFVDQLGHPLDALALAHQRFLAPACLDGRLHDGKLSSGHQLVEVRPLAIE